MECIVGDKNAFGELRRRPWASGFVFQVRLPRMSVSANRFDFAFYLFPLTIKAYKVTTDHACNSPTTNLISQDEL